MGRFVRRRADVRMKFQQNCKTMIKNKIKRKVKKKENLFFFFLLDNEIETNKNQTKKLLEEKLNKSLPKLV